MTSRRKFLETGVLTSIVTGVTLKSTTLAAVHRSSEPESSMLASSLDHYNKSTFEAYVNSDFRIYAHGHSETWLRLVLVEDFPTRETLTGPNECFRLLFSGAADSVLSQGTYSLDHAALGSFALFIVPGKPLDGKVHYEAVFNRRFSSDVRPTAIPNAKQPGKKRPAGWETDTISAPDSGK